MSVTTSIDPTAETSETSSEHLGDNPKNRKLRHLEYLSENDRAVQTELFPEEFPESTETLLLLDDREPGDFVSGDDEVWSPELFSLEDSRHQ